MSRLVYESWRDVERRSTRVTIDTETGLPLIEHVQDVRPILEANKRQSNAYDPHAPNPHGWTKVASIPVVIVDQLKRVGIWYDQKAMDAWLDNPEHRHLRTDGGRRLS